LLTKNKKTKLIDFTSVFKRLALENANEAMAATGNPPAAPNANPDARITTKYINKNKAGFKADLYCKRPIKTASTKKLANKKFFLEYTKSEATQAINLRLRPAKANK